MGRRHKKRIGATAQLIVGEDDDLIEWMNGLPDGTRNGVIKVALRLYAFNDATPPKFATQPRELDDHVIGDLESRFVPMDDFVRLERFTEILADRLETSERLLATERMKSPGLIPENNLVESVEQIDDEKIEKRKDRLKKAKW